MQFYLDLHRFILPDVLTAAWLDTIGLTSALFSITFRWCCVALCGKWLTLIAHIKPLTGSVSCLLRYKSVVKLWCRLRSVWSAAVFSHQQVSNKVVYQSGKRLRWRMVSCMADKDNLCLERELRNIQIRKWTDERKLSSLSPYTAFRGIWRVSTVNRLYVIHEGHNLGLRKKLRVLYVSVCCRLHVMMLLFLKQQPLFFSPLQGEHKKAKTYVICYDIMMIW